LQFCVSCQAFRVEQRNFAMAKAKGKGKSKLAVEGNQGKGKGKDRAAPHPPWNPPPGLPMLTVGLPPAPPVHPDLVHLQPATMEDVRALQAQLQAQFENMSRNQATVDDVHAVLAQVEILAASQSAIDETIENLQVEMDRRAHELKTMMDALKALVIEKSDELKTLMELRRADPRRVG
jgi:hypothetical protein